MGQVWSEKDEDWVYTPDEPVECPVKPAPVERPAEVRVVPSVGKNPVMAEMGRSGGQARAVRLSPARRREIARLGGLARARGK